MNKRDEFDDPEGFFGRLITVKEGRKPRLFENRSLVFSVVVFGVVVVLSSVIWASYPSQNPLTADGSVPIIRADTAAYKVEPQDRGGMAIAHRESTIFDAMRDGEHPKSRVENLLDNSSDEQPIDRAELFAGLKTDLAEATAAVASDATATSTTPANAISSPSTQVEGPASAQDPRAKPEGPIQLARMGNYTSDRPMTEAERRDEAARRNQELLKEPAQPLPGNDNPPATATAKKADVINGDDVKPVHTSEAPDEPEQQAKPNKGLQEKPAQGTKEPAPAKSTAVALTPGKGKAYVQVASVPKESLITSEWATVSGKLPGVAGLPYRIQKADLGAKGIFHRIQVGPMSADDASKLCASIKAQKPGGCLVVK